MKGENQVVKKKEENNELDMLDVDIDMSTEAEPKSDASMDLDFGSKDYETTAPLADELFTEFDDFAKGIEDIVLSADEPMKILIYGPNGSGKTTVAGSFPNALILDLNEHGTSVLAGTGSKRRKINTFEMLQKAYWFLKNGKHDFKTVVLDTVTMMESIVLEYVMGKESDMDASKDKEMPSMRDYGGRANLMKRWVLAFRNLDMNVVFIVQERKSKEEDIQQDDPTVFPDLSAKIGVFLCAAVDIIGRTYVVSTAKEVNGKNQVVDMYRMRLKGDEVYKAKFRVPKDATCPRIIANPTYDKLHKIYLGKYKNDKEK